MKVKDIFTQHGMAIQEESYTCGPVSLLNILHLKGINSYNELSLANLCNANPGIGTTHEDLANACRKIGLHVIEQKDQARIEDIEHNLDNGALVIVNYSSAYSGNGHYAVVTEYDNKALYLRDCAYGFLRLEKRYFIKFWYGADGIKQWYMAVK